MPISCQKFTDFLSRRTEHLDDLIIHDITPIAGWIGMVETGVWKAEDGVSHTYDRFNRVMPDLSVPWQDVGIQSCIGQPCDLNEQIIGFGFTRDEYHLQEIAYATDLFCFDLILSADRAVRQFAFIVKTLRDAASMISSNRLRNEAFRIAGYHWAPQADGTLAPFTFTEMGDLINVVPSVMPGSKLTTPMLQQRVEPQILNGALSESPFQKPAMLELITDSTTLQELRQETTVSDHWRYNEFDVGSEEFWKYGWFGRIGNYNVKVDPHQIRFQINGGVLNRVFPYSNIAATEGIRGVLNDAYINAPVCVHFIWHRRAMLSLVQDTTKINPMMPFAARDFAGKWGFGMNNLVCKTRNQDGSITITPVDNMKMNKGKFWANWRLATQKQYPEFAEVFLALREPACTVGVLPCKTTPAYVPQNYSSANCECDTNQPLIGCP